MFHRTYFLLIQISTVDTKFYKFTLQAFYGL